MKYLPEEKTARNAAYGRRLSENRSAEGVVIIRINKRQEAGRCQNEQEQQPKSAPRPGDMALAQPFKKTSTPGVSNCFFGINLVTTSRQRFRFLLGDRRLAF